MRVVVCTHTYTHTHTHTHTHNDCRRNWVLILAGVILLPDYLHTFSWTVLYFILWARTYHWLEQPQYHFYHNKSMLVATKVLLWQMYFCCDRTFVTNMCLLQKKQHPLAQQKYACRDKHVFVRTNICCHKSFVTTNIILSQQKVCRSKHIYIYFCCNKNDTCGSSRQWDT